MDLWIKSVHVIAVISWMASLLYLPRLFVYHCDAEAHSKQSETFKIMERRLLKAIATPAMLASWIFGLWIATVYHVWLEPWFHVKAVCVFALTGLHFCLAKDAAAFARDDNRKSARYFRFVNEAPAVLMFVIVIMVIVEPF